MVNKGMGNRFPARRGGDRAQERLGEMPGKLLGNYTLYGEAE